MPTVGVTGHRFLAELPRIEAALDLALEHIETVFGGPITLLSALAEGADRLAAEHVLARPAALLEVILPLPHADYMIDFKPPQSRAEFEALMRRATSVTTLRSAATREDAYLAGGEHVLRHSHVLLAIWDGAEAQGRGGTGAIVRQARELGKPLAWIHAGNRKPGTEEPTSLGADQGRVTYERF